MKPRQKDTYEVFDEIKQGYKDALGDGYNDWETIVNELLDLKDIRRKLDMSTVFVTDPNEVLANLKFEISLVERIMEKDSELGDFIDSLNKNEKSKLATLTDINNVLDAFVRDANPYPTHQARAQRSKSEPVPPYWRHGASSSTSEVMQKISSEAPQKSPKASTSSPPESPKESSESRSASPGTPTMPRSESPGTPPIPRSESPGTPPIPRSKSPTTAPTKFNEDQNAEPNKGRKLR